VVEPGATLNVKILEIDEERRRLSLSIKQVEVQNMPMQDLGDQIQAAEAAEAPEAEADEAPEGEAAEAPEVEADEAPEVEADDAPADPAEPSPGAAEGPAADLESPSSSEPPADS
jgi:hypothetical protein